MLKKLITILFFFIFFFFKKRTARQQEQEWKEKWYHLHAPIDSSGPNRPNDDLINQTKILRFGHFQKLIVGKTMKHPSIKNSITHLIY